MTGNEPRSILLVEDEESAREILASLLAMKFPQIDVHVADNGRTGLERFKKYSPAIVITDINMPLISGIRMAREIKSIDAGVKLIAISAYSYKSIQEISVAIGIEFDHFVLKPVDNGKLFAAIEQCLAGQ